jgi:hypothetical protein
LLTLFWQSANRINYFGTFAGKHSGLRFDPGLLRPRLF